MDQKTFVFFDKGSGEILATHIQVAVEGESEPINLDELRKSYRSFPGEEIDPSRVEVLDVSADILGHGRSKAKLSVDLKTHQIVDRGDRPRSK